MTSQTGELNLVAVVNSSQSQNQKERENVQRSLYASKVSLGRVNIVLKTIAMIGFLYDIFADCFAIYSFVKAGDHWHAVVTVAILLVSSLIAGFLNWCWWWRSATRKKYDTDFKRAPRRTKIIRIATLILLTSPIVKMYGVLQYFRGCEAAIKRQDMETFKRQYARLLFENQDVTLLNMAENYLETAPQLLLRLHLVFKAFFQIQNTTAIEINIETDVGPPSTDWNFGIGASVVELGILVVSFLFHSLTMVDYKSSCILPQANRPNLTLLHKAMLILAHNLGVWARFVPLAICLAFFPVFFWIGLFAHFFGAFLFVKWQFHSKTGILQFMWHAYHVRRSKKRPSASSANEDRRSCWKRYYDSQAVHHYTACLFLSVVHIFTFVKLNLTAKRSKIAIFYTVCFVENIAVMTIWLVNYVDDNDYQIRSLVFALQVTFFFLSLILLFLAPICKPTPKRSEPVRTDVSNPMPSVATSQVVEMMATCPETIGSSFDIGETEDCPPRPLAFPHLKLKFIDDSTLSLPSL